MEEPRSRAANPEIIDRWRLKSRTRILLESVLTLAFWTGFLYLLAPLVTLVLWTLGVRIAYTEFFESQELIGLIRIFKSGCLTIIIIGLCLTGWGYYNYLLFRIRGERRNSQVRVCFDEDFSARYQLDLETLQEAKEQSCLLVTLTDDGMKVKSVTASPSPSLYKDRRENKIKPKKWHSPAGSARGHSPSNLKNI